MSFADFYSSCEMCGAEMVPGGGCEYVFVMVVSGHDEGRWMRRIPMELNEGNCHDCNAGPGNTHHNQCDWERCPSCGGQMLGCACVVSETGLIEMARAVK